MGKLKYLFLFFLIVSCADDDDTPIQEPELLQLASARVGTISLKAGQVIKDVPFDKGIVITFTRPVVRESVESAIMLTDDQGNPVSLAYSYLDGDKTVSALPEDILENNTQYTLRIDEVIATTGEVFPGAEFSFITEVGSYELISATVAGKDLITSSRIQNVPLDFTMEVSFSDPLSADTDFSDLINVGSLNLNFELQDEGHTLLISPASEPNYLRRYNFSISPNLNSEAGYEFQGFSKFFYTQLDSSFKFPQIGHEELLTKVQEQTFKYFWDFAHHNSGLARERNTSGDLVTIGGSGFGVMAIIAGIERGFITRQEGIDRFEKIVNFLQNADRFHGVWPHWMNGNTGDVIPFSTKDDGGDLVETAFMIQGLLTVREYLNPADIQEASVISTITQLWEEVEWSWYTKGGENVLYWHWSPSHGWEMGHQIRGWNEGLIVYVLAASSPRYAIDADVYHEGWARNGGIINGNSYYEITLPLGGSYGGPLFFSHYSFLGLDPRNLEDQYANYWEQNVAHSRINHAHAVVNPHDYVGYGENAWGFTASDNQSGYSAHSPTNDLGVITPTAALSSFPYTPEHSMDALEHFYYLMGDRLWKNYGFVDAYNPTAQWYADSYLAIDQGPIIVMIENYRSAVLWDLFMSNPEISAGLEKLGFTSY